MKNSPILLLLLLLLPGCSSKPPRQMQEYNGYTQGTNFRMTYDKNLASDIRPEINQLLAEIEQDFSLYDSSSLLCRVNASDSLIIVDRHFVNVFEASQRVYKKTRGAFNPAIYPLVKFWGFGIDGYADPSTKDSSVIDSLRSLTRFEAVELIQQGNTYFIRKNDPRIQLDFSAIIQGYTVDQLCALMDAKGILNYMVEISGETRAKGKDGQDKPWQAGIDKPMEDPNSRELMAIARLNNSSLASSGSYRRFYVKDGMKYSHTIDPATGYPVSHTLVSTTVFAGSCTDADAYATAFMVMGVDRTKKFIEEYPELGTYLIYTNYKGDWETYISDGLKEKLEVLKNN